MAWAALRLRLKNSAWASTCMYVRELARRFDGLDSTTFALCPFLIKLSCSRGEGFITTTTTSHHHADPIILRLA
jgi:hypothetical protein